MTSKKVSLNVWRSAHTVVTAVQGEIAARWIEVSLYDHDKRLDISEKTAAIYMTKPDKTIVYNTCEILDAKNGLILVELTSQMSAVAGTICDCEIHIMNNKGSLLKILGLTIIIDRSVEDDKAIESSNEFTLLLKALQEANGLIDSVTETLNEKLNEFDAAFDELSQQMQSQMNDWLAVKDEEILHKMQSVDDWLGNGDEQLQQAVTEAQIAVQAAVSQANTAADRANQAVEQMEQVAGELVDGAISEQKNQPNGIAGLDSSGKLIQMPTATDVGAVPTSRKINGKALTGNITLTVDDIGASAIFLASHRVGDLYFTTTPTNPSTVVGGTWAAWGGGRTPVGVNPADTDFKTVEKTGGEKTHVLTEAEIAPHSHIETVYWNAGGSGTAHPAAVEAGDPRKYGGLVARTENTGGGQAHNNLQPYITCYIWKRTT